MIDFIQLSTSMSRFVSHSREKALLGSVEFLGVAAAPWPQRRPT
jgi:hypothetical protein